MQLLANEIDNRETASLAKSIVDDGNFGKEGPKLFQLTNPYLFYSRSIRNWKENVHTIT